MPDASLVTSILSDLQREYARLLRGDAAVPTPLSPLHEDPGPDARAARERANARLADENAVLSAAVAELAEERRAWEAGLPPKNDSQVEVSRTRDLI